MTTGRTDMQTMHSLRRLTSADGILSVYLPIDPSLLPRGHVARAMDLFEETRASFHGNTERFEAEVARVLEFLRGEYVPTGISLVIFSSLPDKIWHVLELQHPMLGLIRFGERPFLLPFDVLAQAFPPAAVVVADHQDAHLYRLVLGDLEAVSKVHSDVPGRQRQGGWAAFRFEEDRQNHIRQHLHKVAEALAALEKAQDFEYLLIGGQDETTHALAEALPSQVMSRYGGGFRVEMFASQAEVARHALTLLRQALEERDRLLVEELIQLALDGRKAALGAQETMQVLAAGRAHALTISDDFVLTPAGESAVEIANKTDAELKVVHGKAAELLSAYEGIGARLRF